MKRLKTFMIYWKRQYNVGVALGRRLFRQTLPLPWLIPTYYFAVMTKFDFVLGLCLGGLGALIRLWAVSWIGSLSRTRGNEHGPLCQRGPYRICRNPLYVGNILLYTGLCVTAGQYLAAIIVGLYTFSYYSFIILYEEDTLSNTSDYRAYISSVDRWLPIANLKSGQSVLAQD